MKNRIWMPLLAAVLTLGGASCSDDDTPGDPEGTVTVNMYDEENGKTCLGDSEIYIDKGMNFVSGNDCRMFVIGKTDGLGGLTIRELGTSTAQAAVQPGYGYAAVRPRTLHEFPSGKLAISTQSDVNFMKFYVVSVLENGDEQVGAAVKYVIVRPEQYGLPEFGSTVLDIDLSLYGYDELPVALPSSDTEYDFDAPSDLFECRKEGSRLLLRVQRYPEEWEWTSYALWLRIRESYTVVYVQLRPY